MSDENYEIEVGDDGSLTKRYDDPIEGTVEDLPEPPRMVSGWQVATVSTPDGTDKALLVTVNTNRGDVVLAMTPAHVGRLVDGLLATLQQEM